MGKRAFLSVLAMARNECPEYPEWLAHYRRQGVEHFYIIDNNSTDNCTERLQHTSDVTSWTWTLRAGRNGSNQAAAYNHFLRGVQSEWVAICDVDEFFFGTQNTTLATFLASLPDNVRQVCVPWTVFGSGGLIEQPACVTASNVMRRSRVTEAGLTKGIGKCIQRTAATTAAHIHRSVLLNETYHRRVAGCICPNLKRCACCGHTGPSPSMACAVSSEAAMGAQRIRLHHYISQSRARMKSKSQAGEADLYSRDRTEYYWNNLEYHTNHQLDITLARQSVCAGMNTSREVERLW